MPVYVYVECECVLMCQWTHVCVGLSLSSHQAPGSGYPPAAAGAESGGVTQLPELPQGERSGVQGQGWRGHMDSLIVTHSD